MFIKQENVNEYQNTLRSPINVLPPFNPVERNYTNDKMQNQENYPPYSEKDLLNASTMSRKRGPYKRYSPNKKKQALDIFYSQASDEQSKKSSTKNISKSLDIPCNTLKRWIRVGIYRRKGAGRKLMDPEMEEKLYKWCKTEMKQKKGKLLGREIRKMARILSTNKDVFKASKGWLVGFLRRFKLEDCAFWKIYFEFLVCLFIEFN